MIHQQWTRSSTILNFTPFPLLFSTLALLLVGLGMSGCADLAETNGNGASSLDTRKQAAQGPPAADFDLGEGVHTTLNSQGERVRNPSGHKCQRGDYADFQEINDIRTTTFYGYRRSYVQRKIDIAVDLSTEFGIGASVSQKVKDTYDGTNTKRKLFVLVKVKNKSRSYGPVGEDSTYGECQSGTPHEEASDFISQCGQEYVDKQIYGGYVIMEMEVSGITTNQLKEITNVSEANAPGASLNVDALFQELRQMTSISANFDLQSIGGAPLPQGNFSDGITEQEWKDYYSALQDWEGGVIIENKYQVYDRENYENCVQDFENEDAFPRALTCYNKMSRAVRKLDRSSREIKRIATRVDWLLNNKNYVSWGENPSDNEDDYEDWWEDYRNCYKNPDSSDSFEQISEQFTACENRWITATQQGSYDEVCPKCESINSQCQASHLENLAGGLPTVYIRVPDSVEIEAPQGKSNYDEPSFNSTRNGTSGDGITLKSTSSHLCALTRVSGGFRGYGEYMRLRERPPNSPPSTVGSQWHFESDSGRTDPDHHLSSTITCVKKDNFFGTNGTQDWADEKQNAVDNQSDGVAPPESPTALPSNTNGYLHALSGLSGAMAGFGEYGSVSNSWGTSELEVGSNRGAMRAYSTSFALKNGKHEECENGTCYNRPRHKGVVIAKNGSRKSVEERLIPIKEGFCFLTHVGGELDGGGEIAEVRQEGEFWEVRAKGVCNGHGGFLGWGKCNSWKGIEARAMCYYYNQNDI